MSAVLPLVPRPERLAESGAAPFVVTGSTAVVVAPGAEQAGAVVARALSAATGFAVPLRSAPGDAAGLVVLALTGETAWDRPGAQEGYTLTADAAGVVLTAGTVDGLHRAAATLGQLLVARDGAATVPAVRIEDAPRYAWRGLSVDVARHFLPVADLEVLIDLIAGYKLNVLHLHLTDDQGWRLDLPSHPELVERSSAGGVGGDPGGAYSSGDWARLVGAAAARGIVVVPEIDVPGHVNAALHAVPALSPGAPPEAYQGVEVGFSSLRSDLPATGPFLTAVFHDLAAMTPGEHLHLGGDEAHHTPPDEYLRLVGAAVDAVRATGRTVVGWQEVAAAPLPAGTVVQVWDTRADLTSVLAAARAGARVLMSPADRAYLDIQYVPGHPLGQDWAGYVELRDSYDWDPAEVLPGLDPAAVIGVEAAVWTETLRTLDDVTAMLLPRLAALAEVAWSSSGEWADFRQRVAPHAAAWDRAGLTWYASPQVDWVR